MQQISFSSRWREQAPEPIEVEVFGETHQVQPKLPAMVTGIAADVHRLQMQDRAPMTVAEQFALGEQIMDAFTRVLDYAFGHGATKRWVDAGAAIEELRDLFFWVCAGYRFVDPVTVAEEATAPDPLPETGEASASASTTSSTTGS